MIMETEKVTLYRVNNEKTGVVTEFPMTVASHVYDDDNGQFLNETLAQKVKVHATVDAMKADRSLRAGMSVQTNSYRYIFDGGQARYRIVADNTLVDDAGSVHNLANGLKAQLIFEKNRINIKQFGAYGGSGYADDTLPITRAVAYLNTTLADARNSYWNGGEIYFPGGAYICKVPLYVNLNIRFRGDAPRGFDYYQGKNASTILRFQDFTNTNVGAINFVGYLQDGSVHTNFAISVVQADNAIAPAENVSMIDIGLESSGTNKIKVGLNLINATNSRFKRVSITGFRYSINANCSWGSSFENIFSVSTYGGILFTRSNASVSLRDSYFTVSNTTIPPEDVLDSFISAMPHPNQSFGIFAETAYLDITNVIVERANIMLYSKNSKVNITGMTNEYIDISVIDSVDSNVSLDGYWMFNLATVESELLNATGSNVTLKNIDTKNFARLITINDTSYVSIINSKSTSNFIYANETTAINVTNDRTTRGEITFAEGIIPTYVAGFMNRYSYRQNKQVHFNLRCTTEEAKPIGTEFLVGTLSIGYRPSFEIVQYTKNGTLRILSTGAIYFNPTVSTTFILGDLINYTLT